MGYDIHIQLIDPSEQSSVGASFVLNFVNPILVTGFQKLANRFFVIFLTPKGSSPLYPAKGTEFSYLRGSNVTDPGSLQAALTEYVDDAVTQLKALDGQAPTLTANERIRSANIVKFSLISQTEIDFWVELVNQAGVRMKVLIPYVTGVING